MKTLFCAVFIVWGSSAQTGAGTVAGPMLGLVFDRDAGAVRVLSGIPAASTLGGSFEGGRFLGGAALSAERGYAIGREAETGAMMLISATGRRALPGAGPGASLIALSPRGTAAALYFSDTDTAQIFTGMPDASQMIRQVTLDSPPIAIAVSDDGANLLAVGRDGGNGQRLTFYQAGQPQVLLRARRVTALEFMPGSPNALIAEPDSVKLVTNGAGLQTVADWRDGIADVVSVAASNDGSRVIIAMQSGQVAVRDLNAGTQVLVSCACAPSGLARLRGNAVFRLNEMGNGPLWVLDADSPEPRILFVAAAGGGSQ